MISFEYLLAEASHVRHDYLSVCDETSLTKICCNLGIELLNLFDDIGQ